MDEELSDLELVKRVQKRNCEKSLKILIDKHSPLCFDIFKRYLPALTKTGTFADDIFSEKHYLIYKSALSFKTSKKTKFSTWLGNQMRYHCLNALNKNKLIPVSDEIINLNINKNPHLARKTENFGESIDYVFNLLRQLKDKRVKQVFELRYFADISKKKKAPWSLVAKRMSVSTQTAINLHGKGLKMLKSKMIKSQNKLDEI
jgi:RNA polymerase sigma factor (sigma-70 family)